MKTTVQLLPFMVFLAVLPFPEAVAPRLVCLAAAFLIVAISWRRLDPPPLPCRWAVTLWAGVAIASLVFAVDPAYSLIEIMNEVGFALMAFVGFFAWTRSEKRLRLACFVVLAGFAVISGSVLVGAYFRSGQWPSDAYYGDVGGVSNFLVTTGPVVALTAALFGRRHLRKWLGLLGLLFLSVALLSGQRALWPAIGVQAALGCLWLWQDRAVAIGPVRLALTGIILLALVGGGIYVSELYRTGGDPASPVAMGNDMRPRVWKKVGEEILAHPLIGAGFGRAVMSKAYPTLLPAEDKRFWYPHDAPGLAGDKVFWHPHNLVFNYGIGAGVPGMAAVLALFAALAWRFWQLALRGERLARLAGLAGAAMVVGVLARNMANDFFVRDAALLFWALSGMLFGYALRRDRRQARRHIPVTGTSSDDRGGRRAG